jgi:hypothetical protein
MSDKEFKDFANEVIAEIRELRVAIQGDDLGNAGILPTVQQTVARVHELSSQSAKIRLKQESYDKRLYDMECNQVKILDKLSAVDNFKYWIMGGLAVIGVLLMTL